MIRIQLNNEWMDTYIGEEIQLSWDGFRFQKSLRAGYTNDVTIPKTEKNLRLLRAVGLLDSQTQMFGTKTVNCILQNGIQMTPMMLQIAAVTSTEIKVCLYEDTFPEYFKGKKIKDFFVDGPATIWPWRGDTATLYPNVFRHYNYGMRYDPMKAQYHPVRPLSNILVFPAQQGGYTMPVIPNTWMLMATKKTVCPQNLKQVLEFNSTSMEGTRFKIHGGQHITNDCAFSTENEFITYNRNYVYATLEVYVIWERKGTVHQNKTLFFELNGNHRWWCDLMSGSADFGYQQFSIPQHQFNQNNTISFEMPDINSFEFVSVVCEITYTTGGWYNYISEEDYGQELEYVGRCPEFRIGSNGYQFIPCNGNTYTMAPFGHPIPTPNLCFSYFGYYCNLPDIPMCDIWYSLQWILGGKLSFDHQRLIMLDSADKSAVIEGNITEIRPKSDKLGQKNYIKFKGTDPKPTFIIPNEWLAENVTIHENILGDTFNQNYYEGVLNQYSNPEYDEDFQYWTCDFEEIDNPVIMTLNGSRLEPISLHTFDLDKLNQAVEVDITTFSPQLRDKDIIYLDGRRFFVVSGKSSLDNQKTELTCLLYPNTNQLNRQINRI